MSDPKQKATNRPSLISLGERQVLILERASELGINAIIRRRSYAAKYHEKPTTVYDNLNSLVHKGLMQKGEGLGGGYSITEKGIEWLKAYKNHGSGGRHGAYRGVVTNNLSQHAVRFELHIKERGFFHPSDLSKLGDVQQPVQMQGWEYHRVLMGANEIRVFPNKVVLYLEEIIDEKLEQTQVSGINKAVDIAEKLCKIGLIVDGIILEKAHWARIGSLLSDVLVKHLGKYWYTLKDGSAFWIDFSGNTLEDETDNSKLRARLDAFVEDLPKSKAVFSDVDNVVADVTNLKEVAHLQLATTQNLVRLQIGAYAPNAPMPKTQKQVGDYFG